MPFSSPMLPPFLSAPSRSPAVGRLALASALCRCLPWDLFLFDPRKSTQNAFPKYSFFLPLHGSPFNAWASGWRRRIYDAHEPPFPRRTNLARLGPAFPRNLCKLVPPVRSLPPLRAHVHPFTHSCQGWRSGLSFVFHRTSARLPSSVFPCGEELRRN